MKALKRFVSLVVVSVFVMGCNGLSTEEKEYDAMMKEIIDVHDEVMPKMSEIAMLQGKLREKIDSTTTSIPLKSAVNQLSAAHFSMMEWMENFGARFPYEERTGKKPYTQDFETRKKMLEEELTAVKKMREDVLNSIKGAEVILAE